MRKQIQYETERLFIRPSSIEDAALTLQLLNSPKYLEFIGDRQVDSLEKAQAYIEAKMLPQLQELGYSSFTVIRKEDQNKMGFISLYKRSNLEWVDIGFAFLPEYEGQGYAFESSNKIKEVALEDFGIQEICGVTLEINIASRQLLEKLGLRFRETVQWTEDGEELMLYWMSLVN